MEPTDPAGPNGNRPRSNEAKEAEVEQGTDQASFEPQRTTGGPEPTTQESQQTTSGTGQKTNGFDRDVRIAYPELGELQLRIAMGPGRLKLSPAADTSADWITGTYHDPTKSIPIRVETNGNKVRISQSVNFPSIPRPRGIPVLDLQLGTARSFVLTIDGGANEIDAELGGLLLTKLECRFGAGQAKFKFGTPNPAQMERLSLSAGAAEVRASDLANANAAEISVEGGAAAVHLDFGGTLARDCRARINVGAATVDITVPMSTAARIAAHSVLAGVDIGDGFQTKEGAFWTPAGVSGQTPLLSIDATVALAGLKIRAAQADGGGERVRG
jgi:hypothetical protein